MVMREEKATGSFVVGGFFLLIFQLFLHCMASECSVMSDQLGNPSLRLKEKQCLRKKFT